MTARMTNAELHEEVERLTGLLGKELEEMSQPVIPSTPDDILRATLGISEDVDILETIVDLQGLDEEELEARKSEPTASQIEAALVSDEEAERGTTRTVSGEEVAVQEVSVRPVQIAAWIKTSKGIDIKPSDIYMQGSDGFRVTYTVQGGRYPRFPDKNQQWSILLDAGTKQLVQASPHQHEYHYPMAGGLTNRSAPRICNCSDLEPVS